MSQNLEFFYAVINVNTGFCGACITSTTQRDLPNFIEVPELGDYVGKYYNINGDQMWYLDAEFTQLWEECPSHNT